METSDFRNPEPLRSYLIKIGNLDDAQNPFRKTLDDQDQDQEGRSFEMLKAREEVGARYLRRILSKPCCAKGVQEEKLYTLLGKVGFRSEEISRLLLLLTNPNMQVIFGEEQGYDRPQRFKVTKKVGRTNVTYTREDLI